MRVWGLLQASESVDAVVSLGMLSGLAFHAQRQLAASAARVLKPGGVFLFVERGGQQWTHPCAGACLLPKDRELHVLVAQATLEEQHRWCRRLCSLQAREWVRACSRLPPLPASHSVNLVTCTAAAQHYVLWLQTATRWKQCSASRSSRTPLMMWRWRLSMRTLWAWHVKLALQMAARTRAERALQAGKELQRGLRKPIFVVVVGDVWQNSLASHMADLEGLGGCLWSVQDCRGSSSGPQR